MPKAWKKWDLEGGGLQSANLALIRRRKRRIFAYLLWPLFPTGAHAWYLAAPARAGTFLASGIVTVVSFATGHTLIGMLVIAAAFLYAVHDLFWIDRRIIELDKLLRLAISLRPGTGAPAKFAGRYPDAGLDAYLEVKASERAGHPVSPTVPGPSPGTGRPPSFAEQEALLRQHARGKTKK